MSWERLAEERIEGAMADGGFDPVEGKGKPLDLREYFAAPEELRAGNAVLKNANVVPQEVEWLRRIEALERTLERATGDQRDEIRDELQLLRTSYSIHRERRAARGVGRP